MNSGQSQRQSLKTLLQPPMLNLGSPKEKPATASHSRFVSTSMVSSNSGFGGPHTHFDVTLPNFPLSPKPATTTMLNPGDQTNRSQKSMRLIKRISSFAKNASKEFETKVKIINNIERRKIQAISTDKLFNINHTNSPNAAISPHTSIGDLFAKPSALVFSEEISLVEKKKAPLLVEHHRFVYFQIDCARFPSPLVINIFKGADTATNTKLKVYVSKTNKKPSALSCDYSVESRNVKIYEKDYKSHFETPTYHFGVYSENRFEGTIIFFFGEEAARPKHMKTQSLFMSPRAKLKMKVAEDTITSEEIREIQREKFMKRWALSKGQNKIEINKHPLTPKEREHSFNQRRALFETRINEVLLNKKLRDEEKMQKKLYSIGKHDMIKSIKDYVDSQRDIVLTKQAFQKDWLIISTFLTMMHHLRNHYKVKKAAHKKRQEIYLRFHFFVIRYKRSLHKKGETLRARLAFDIRSSLECHARALLKAKEAEYTHFIAAAFRDFKLAANIACHFLIPEMIARKVRDRWLTFKAKKNLYKKLFLLMWDKFHQATLAEFSPKTPSKPQLVTVKSFERKGTIGVEKKAPVQPATPKGQQEDKRAKFGKYMMEFIYYKYNKAFKKYRQRLAELDPADRKMADYAKFFLVEHKTFMKNALISKIEKLEYHALNVEDLNLGNKALVLYRKRDLIRPPRLFYIPREDEIKQAIINVARGDEDVGSLDSIDDNNY